MATFTLTDKQKEALEGPINSGATHILFEGGSRSGKTALHVRNIILRSQKAPKSRHAILRYRYNHVKASIMQDTFPKIMDLAYPKIPYNMNKTDSFVTFANGSEVWFGGLDDKERTEKILGNEYSSIFLNECSQISNESRLLVTTRLAQKVIMPYNGQYQPLRMYYDCNPPSKAHWCFKIFHKLIEPETRKALPDPENYVYFKMNPTDNRDNLSAEYLETLSNMTPRMRKRFFEGEYADENPNQLFNAVTIDQNRVLDGKTPQFVRVVVAVDPSGSGDEDNLHNDAIGICVVGLGIDGRAYLLEDCTVKAGPATWGKIATDAYDRHQADVVVGEKNYGGAMVQFVIQTARPATPFKEVTATRGKSVRAEPISALYEQGKVRHVGYFPDLEDELEGFSTMGYLGEQSPNRADALIWGISELFPGIVQRPVVVEEEVYDMAGSWMSV